jgi:hypothetical protein
LRRAVAAVTNVTAAVGARPPEPQEQARRRAPDAWRTPVSCGTLAEFVAAAQRIPGVAEAVAALDHAAGAPRVIVWVRSATHLWTPADLIAEVARDLSARCLAGRRVLARGPRLVPLEITLAIRLWPGAREPLVLAALSAAFAASGDGFFAPRSLRFGQAVFASALVARAAGVPGVASAEPRRLARGGETASTPTPAALLLDRAELPLVTGLSDTSERGWVRFIMEPAA